MRKSSASASVTDPQHGDREGVVVAHLGKGLAVEDVRGEIVQCHTRRKLGAVVVGDRVTWEIAEGGLGHVTALLPRRTVLMRPGPGGKPRPVAANLDQVLVVLAPHPAYDLLLIDQFLVASHRFGLEPALVVNKIDLVAANSPLFDELQPYQTAGYSVYSVSTRSGAGLAQVNEALRDRTSLLAGQSGVGKSSLSQYFLPERDLRIGGLSEGSGKGRHTTTTAVLYRLPNGGRLIDSPGLSILGLADTTVADLAYGYREFRPWLAQCQFRDCKHLNDKNCAVRAAVAAGAIHTDRYQRYLKLLDKLGSQLQPL